MKNTAICLLLLVLVSCKKSFTPSDLVLLNGNWEIENVELPNGRTNDYTINPSGEAIQFKDGKGTKTKIMLSLDGSIKPTPRITHFVVLDSNNVTYLKNSLSESVWLETLKEISDTKLVLENQQNIIYQYKRILNTTDGKTE